MKADFWRMPDAAWSRCPSPDLAGALRRYYEHGVPPGSFLTALLSDKLIDTVRYADPAQAALLVEWATWLDSDMDGRCFGSAEKVALWLVQGGLAGAA